MSIFNDLPDGPITRLIARAFVEGNEQKEKIDRWKHHKAEEFEALVDHYGVASDRLILFRMAALNSFPTTFLKTVTVEGWIRHTKAISDPKQEQKEILDTFRYALYNEFAPGLLREDEHTREDDWAYIGPAIRAGLKHLFTLFNDKTDEKQINEAKTSLITFATHHRFFLFELKAAIDDQIFNVEPVAQRFVGVIKRDWVAKFPDVGLTL